MVPHRISTGSTLFNAKRYYLNVGKHIAHRASTVYRLHYSALSCGNESGCCCSMSLTIHEIHRNERSAPMRDHVIPLRPHYGPPSWLTDHNIAFDIFSPYYLIYIHISPSPPSFKSVTATSSGCAVVAKYQILAYTSTIEKSIHFHIIMSAVNSVTGRDAFIFSIHYINTNNSTRLYVFFFFFYMYLWATALCCRHSRVHVWHKTTLPSTLPPTVHSERVTWHSTTR